MHNSKNNPTIVIAAVIEKDNKFLIAQRGKKDHLYGKWEFSGGKMEAGETDQQYLQRELNEEFGIHAEVGSYLCTVDFEHKGKQMKMLAYYVTSYRGELTLFEHQQIKWVSKDELSSYDYPSPDLPIIELLKEKS